MSVLYKALQKAEKENELRQSATSDSNFDPQRLAASGAMKMGRGRGMLNRVIMSAILVLAVGGGAAFLLFKDTLMPSAPQPQAMLPTVDTTASAPAEAAVEANVAAASGETSATAAEAPAPDAAAPPAETTAIAEVPEQTGSVPLTPQANAEQKLVAAARPAPAQPQRPEPMPNLPADAPARMLSPPISVNRAEFALAGVGNQVQVREVSQVARTNVNAGYESLIRGSYDTALGFYDRALTDEPNSVLALLGRGVALQKLGRGSEAEVAYQHVLKLDPQNREALTNITAIAGERAPQDALTRLLELERDYTGFSPIKAQIGLAYAKLGTMPQALDYLRRAVALTPEAPMYIYNLALVQDHMGLREQALASYERVLALASGGRAADLSTAEIERRVRFLKAR